MKREILHLVIGIGVALTALGQFIVGETVAGAILFGAVYIGSAIEQYGGTHIDVNTPKAVEIHRD